MGWKTPCHCPPFIAHIHQLNILQSKGQYFLRSDFLPTDWQWVFLYVLRKKSSSATNPSTSPAASLPGLWVHGLLRQGKTPRLRELKQRCIYRAKHRSKQGRSLKAESHSGLEAQMSTENQNMAGDRNQAMRSLEAHGYQRAKHGWELCN